ncbi:T9SS type A sorting domain-containing protein [bacterium]|nr:T9SS type A sorting domain-containing protein [bacterium]
MRSHLFTSTFMILLAIASHCAATPAEPGDEYWSSIFSHSADLNGPIYSMTMYGDDVIVSGGFTHAGNTALNGVARWDGTGWRPLGSGITEGWTYEPHIGALAEFEGNLYADEWCWNGENWTAAFGLYGGVHCLAVHGDYLVVGGEFTDIDGTPVNHLFLWDGATATELGGGCGGDVRALTSHDGILYVGGQFTQAGTLPVQNIAVWDGTSWAALGEGIYGDQEWIDTYYGSFHYPATVRKIFVYGNDLWVGGQFTSAGDVLTSALARWDGTAWHDGGDISLYGRCEEYTMESWICFPPCVYSMATDAAGDLIVSGRFGLDMGYDTNSFLRLDVMGWHTIGGGFVDDWGFSTAYVVLPLESGFLAGGDFTNVGGTEAISGVRRDGSWYPLVEETGLGTDGYVFSSLIYQGKLVLAGSFDDAGGVAVGNIATFTGEQWQPLGDPGIDGAYCTIRDMVEFEQDLVAAGDFTYADGEQVSNVARWNGETWLEMGEGLPCGEVAALCIHNGDLYAAGGDQLYPHPPNYTPKKDFTDTGYVYRWDGFDWELIVTTDEHLEGAVRALASYDGKLVIAGSFTMANGVPMDGIAIWDDGLCSEFGGGLHNWVRCLEVVGDDLYAGGDISIAGDEPAAYIVRWDGSAWHDVGGGLAGGAHHVGPYDLEYLGGRLYATGRFDTAGGSPSRNIAFFEGGTWHAMGSGLGETPTTLAVKDRCLYVGGRITEAGGLSVGGLARWDDGPVPVMVSGFRGRRDGLAVELCWEIAASLTGGVFHVWRDDPDGLPRLLPTESVCDGPACMYLDDAAPPAETHYRLQWAGDDGISAWVADTNVSAAELPRAVRFVGAHPNPFNPRVTVVFTVGAPQRVRVRVVDARGRELARLVDRRYASGRHEVSWEGLDDEGRAAPAGVYFLRLEGDDGRDTAKISLLR